MAATIARPPIQDTITLDSTADNVTAITLHKNTRRVLLHCTSDFKVAFSGTDGAAIGADYTPYDGNIVTELLIAGRARNLQGEVLYISGDVGSATLRIEALAH